MSQHTPLKTIIYSGSADSASGSQATDKRLKVICGANTSYLADSDWIGNKTPFTICEVRVSFEAGGETIGGISLIIDTELIRYKWQGVNGDYPDYQKLIPTEFNTFASFDTVEAIKATNSLKALSDNPKDYPIDLTIGNGKIVMANPDNKGQAELVADTNGEGKVRIDGSYLASVLKACGGMVDFSLANGYSPMLFTVNGYQLVVMPMLTNEAQEQAKADREAKQAETPTEPVAEQAEPTKAKRSRAKEPVKTK